MSYIANLPKSRTDFSMLSPAKVGSTSNAETNSLHSLRTLINTVTDLSRSDKLSLLGKFADRDVVRKVEELINVDHLLALVIWLRERYWAYNGPRIGLSVDSEGGETLNILVIFENCSWEKWVEITKTTKREMNRAGMGVLKGKIGIMCLEGLQNSVQD